MAKDNEKNLDIIPSGDIHGRAGFVKFKHTAFEIGKVILAAVKTDDNNKQLGSCDFYLEVAEAGALGFDFLTGTLAREAAAALKEGNSYKELRKWQGGTDADKAKREDGKCEARTLTILPSTKYAFCIRVESGPGRCDKNGDKVLYVPEFKSGKGEFSLMVPVDVMTAKATGYALVAATSGWIKDETTRRHAEYNEAWKKSKYSENTPKTTASQPKTSSNPPKTTAKPVAVPPKAKAKPADTKEATSEPPSTGMFTCLTDIMFSKGNSAYIKCRREDGTEGYMRFIGCDKELALRRAEITSAATTKKAIDFLYTEEVNEKNQYIWYFVS